MTIKEILNLKESEDKIEFKEAKTQYNYNNGLKSVLGYVCALANEGGGILVFGIKETKPYTLVNSQAYIGRIGKLEQDIYKDKNIRVKVNELFDENNNRVVVIEIPSRPIGRMFYHENIPLMRVGDSLERMSEEMYLSIIMEKEPDFSSKICKNLTINDLDEYAFQKLKEKYAIKQANPKFIKLSKEQILNDLELSTKEGLTYAALLLLGKEEALSKFLPNSQINIEYRTTTNQTSFDKRYTFLKPIFIAIDEIWNQLNNRNLEHKLSDGPYKFDIPYFNEEVIREAILNAISHRDYTINSETIIKQYPDKIVITNAGGFPKGVTLDNILTTNSVPRSRLLTQILEKTGLVERSGQGIDKIYRITLSEGKPYPDYSKSDIYQVELVLEMNILDKAFPIFLNSIQNNNEEFEIGTFETIALYKIKEGESKGIDSKILKSLVDKGYIKRIGGSASEKFNLSQKYHDFNKQTNEYEGMRSVDVKRILDVFETNPKPKMKDFIEVFKMDMTRDQIRYLINKSVGIIILKSGKGKSTYYFLKNNNSGNSITGNNTNSIPQK